MPVSTNLRSFFCSANDTKPEAGLEAAQVYWHFIELFFVQSSSCYVSTGLWKIAGWWVSPRWSHRIQWLGSQHPGSAVCMWAAMQRRCYARRRLLRHSLVCRNRSPVCISRISELILRASVLRSRDEIRRAAHGKPIPQWRRQPARWLECRSFAAGRWTGRMHHFLFTKLRFDASHEIGTWSFASSMSRCSLVCSHLVTLAEARVIAEAAWHGSQAVVLLIVQVRRIVNNRMHSTTAVNHSVVDRLSHISRVLTVQTITSL